MVIMVSLYPTSAQPTASLTFCLSKSTLTITYAGVWGICLLRVWWKSVNWVFSAAFRYTYIQTTPLFWAHIWLVKGYSYSHNSFFLSLYFLCTVIKYFCLGLKVNLLVLTSTFFANNKDLLYFIFISLCKKVIKQHFKQFYSGCIKGELIFLEWFSLNNVVGNCKGYFCSKHYQNQAGFYEKIKPTFRVFYWKKGVDFSKNSSCEPNSHSWYANLVEMDRVVISPAQTWSERQ